jgi:murein DD-endopeptidase MepM/ murein hydrolase activator NlpD
VKRRDDSVTRSSRRHTVPLCRLAGALAASALLLLAAAVTAGRWPWQRRIGKVETRHNLAYQQHVKAGVWPREPDAPAPVDAGRFRQALGELCGRMPEERLEKYAGTILQEAGRFGGDPFVLGALVYHQSGCLPKTPDWETRFGLTRIDVAMHAPHIRGKEYRYFLKKDGEWTRQALKADRYPFNQWKAEKAASNLYFAAVIISVLTRQCPMLDQEFGGVPHRHPISHWFFGDKVRSTEPEDALLTVRRRLIHYYLGAAAAPAGEFRDVPLSSPLDGAPRLVLDYFGNRRGLKQTNGHQGIDLAGLTGEPVRAVAKGRVVFAGVDLPGDLKSRQTTPDEAASFARNALGKGGLWVTLNHGNGFRTCYMHLSTLAVTQQDTVEAGQIIGTLGNTGTTSSGPHLHLEFRTDEGGREDPAAHLEKVLVNPFR